MDDHTYRTAPVPGHGVGALGAVPTPPPTPVDHDHEPAPVVYLRLLADSRRQLVTVHTHHTAHTGWVDDVTATGVVLTHRPPRTSLDHPAPHTTVVDLWSVTAVTTHHPQETP